MKKLKMLPLDGFKMTLPSLSLDFTIKPEKKNLVPEILDTKKPSIKSKKLW